jgi:hypothetical protein
MNHPRDLVLGESPVNEHQECRKPFFSRDGQISAMSSCSISMYDLTFYQRVCCWCIGGCAEARFGKFVCSFDFEEINFVFNRECFARRDPNVQK